MMANSAHNLEETLILRALESGPLDLQAVSQRIGGMYLPDLASVLTGLVARGVIVPTGSRFSLRQPVTHIASRELPGSRIRLPEPHPANLDWRFDERTVLRLTESGLSELSDGETGLLIGVPSVLAHWHLLQPQTGARLLEISKATVGALNTQMVGTAQSASCFDVCQPLDWNEARPFGVCIADPPWYREHYLGSLGIASGSIPVGRKLFMSLLPPLVRPGADTDRSWLLEQAASLGFHLVALEQAALRYATPAYERNSLLLAGIEAGDWRQGDLAVLAKTTDVERDARIALLAPLSQTRTVESEFEEVLLNDRVVMIREPFDDEDAVPEVVHLEPSDILATVSRRYPLRARVDLWLSDNRVYGLKGRAAFRSALAVLSGESRPPNPLVDSAKISQAIRLIGPLLSGDVTQPIRVSR
jgi:hypothetical protein